VNIYVPTAAMVIVSFISFMVPVEIVPGRMALLITIFLMLVNIGNSERSRSPIVRTLAIQFRIQLIIAPLFHLQLARLTALDIWLLSCMGFVAAALLEYAVLLNIKYGRDEKNKRRGITKREVDKKCKKLDRMALILFSVANALFNLCYFSHFLSNL
jgi:hypothetical protein